jgi:hypothetical protein
VPLLITYDKQVVDKVREGALAANYTLPAHFQFTPIDAKWVIMVAVCAAAITWAYIQSKRPIETGEEDMPIAPETIEPHQAPDLDRGVLVSDMNGKVESVDAEREWKVFNKK